MNYVLMVTGSRLWLDKQDAIYSELAYHTALIRQPITLIHGGAKGVDEICARFGEMHEWNVISFPPEYDLYGKAAPHIRNSEMIAMKPSKVLAFPRYMSAGTVSTMQKALKAGLKVYPTYYEDIR